MSRLTMENPVFHQTVPLRPIPVYGIRNHPRPSCGGLNLGAKPGADRAMLAKQFNIIPHMRPYYPLGDYRINQIPTLGNPSASQILNDVNKFSVKTHSLFDRTSRQHAIAQDKVQTPEQPKLLEINGACTGRGGMISKPTPASEASRSPMEGTVPVIIHCGNPFPSQYGFGRKVFPCPQCRYTTDRRNNLKRHMLTMHQTCSKTLECCGLMFATKASLREHAMIFHYHGYTCFYCGRRFCRKALLKRHLSVHNGQKDFVCPVCDYATSHKSNLERHRKVHCRPEGEDKSDSNSGNDVTKWENDCDVTDDVHNAIDMSSDDDEEIIVDSD
ncbi:Z324A-like protein [Mya arenaria]|uniref:Z324A-like protein n=1 Tax=Mya arenaria TaxID=6604 RepID=A0ABY7G0J8_MYAAR|nr:zinc finger protein 250-like [Mya arenaria]WAR27967.1 Z324A-like protein [Mya arenaria]